jgi:hypothetical protein
MHQSQTVMLCATAQRSRVVQKHAHLGALCAMLQAMVRGMEVARCEEAMQKSQDQCEADVAAAGSDVSKRLEAARADLALALEAQAAAHAELANTKELQLEAEAARQAAIKVCAYIVLCYLMSVCVHARSSSAYSVEICSACSRLSL